MADGEPRSAWTAGALAALALGGGLTGCRAPSTIVTSVGEGSTENVAGLLVGFEGASADPDGGTIIVRQGERELTRGWARAGSELPLTLAGRDCVLRSRGPFSYDASDAKHQNPQVSNPGGGPIVTSRTYRRVGISLGCSDGPVPGSVGAARGADPRRGLANLFGPGLLGGVAGWFARSDRKGGEQIGAALLLLLAAIAVALALAITMSEGAFRATLAVAGAGMAIAGLTGGRLWKRKRPHVAIAWWAGAGLGALPLALLTPAWTYGGPLAALACAAGAAVIASVIAVMIKPLL